MTPNQEDFIKKGLWYAVFEAYGNSTRHGFWADYHEMMKACADLDTSEPSPKWAAKYKLDTRLHKIALIHSELGEMTEGVRKPSPDQHCPKFTSEEIEAADVLIRLFDYAGAFNLRLSEAVLAKMAYNETRPHMHGKGA